MLVDRVAMTIINGRYELQERMGEGGMAEVYRATQINLSRQVAIKFIKPDSAGEFTIARFKREAKAIAQLNHPNITHVYDFDVAEDGRYYMVMELLQGQDLANFLKNNAPLKMVDILTIMKGTVGGLRYAHERHIIHRDIKPSNIFITDQLQVKIMDFGIAKWMTGSGQTDDGMTVGTPKYFAPEQALGKEVDARVDLYSLGVVYYELLTGSVPFDGDNLANIVLQHLHTPAPDPRQKRPDLPPLVTTMVMKMMAKDPQDRYPSAAEFQNDLAQLSYTITNVDNAILPTISFASLPTDEPARNWTSTLSQVMLGRRVSLPLTAIILAAILLVAAAIVGFGWWPDTERNGGEGVNPVANIAPVAEREYLILVAQWPDDSEGTLHRRIEDALRRSDSLGFSSTLTYRIESLPIPIQTAEEAQSLGETVGAQLVVWGAQDETGVEVIFQDIFAEPRSVHQLRFIIPNTADYNAILNEDMPIALRFYLNSMLLHHFVRTSDIDSLAEFGFVTADQQVPELRVVPPSDVDRHVLSMFIESDQGNVEGTIEAATNVLRLAPDDFTLLFLRFYNEGFYKGNLPLAKADAEELYRKMGSTNFSEWVLMNVSMAEQDYDAVLEQSERLNPDDLGYAIAFSYRQLALLMQGRYGQVQAEITDDFAKQSVYGLPVWDAIKAMTYAIQGDDERLAELGQQIQSNRNLGTTANFVTSITKPPLAFYIIGGYISELNGNAVAATLIYPLATNIRADQYIVNWRRGVLADQAGNTEAAYNFYQFARNQAPVPFPIAVYQQALIAEANPDDVPETACELLDEAQTLATSDTGFYSLLLEKIMQAKADWGC
ncbi:MAG: hypothetical protein DPW16_20600 [Chloroflexi bacterium]|nr:hypothetical protein [Chloroflexota bacterium]